MINDQLWIEHGRVGCDKAVGDGKSKGCLMLAELELDTCWDQHPCSSLPPYFRIHPRSAIDLSLTYFSSLLQCLPLGCPIGI